MRAHLLLAALLFAHPAAGQVLDLQRFLDDGERLLPDAITVNADGTRVYVAGAEGPNGGTPAVFVLSRDPATGRLASIEVTPGTLGRFGGALLASPDGKHLYAAGENELGIFAVNPAYGWLTLLAAMPFPDGVESLAGSPDGTRVAVGEGVTYGGFRLFARNAQTGALTPLDAAEAPDLYHPRVAEFHPGGEQLVATTTDELRSFAIDAFTGALGPLQTIDAATAPFPGGKDLAFSPDGAVLYDGSRSIHVFQRAPDTGLLSFVESEAEAVLPGGINTVLPSPDGAHLYAIGVVLNAYARSPADGSLSLLWSWHDDEVTGGFYGPEQQAAMAPDGAHLYVLNLRHDRIEVFARDAGTSDLALEQQVAGFLGGIQTLYGSRAVVASTDGRHVYVAAQGDYNRVGNVLPAVTAFTRNPANGRIDLLQALEDDVDGVDGIDRTSALALAPGGGQLYVTGAGADDAVAVFSRDPDTGLLAFLEAHENGTGGVEGLADASGVAASPDGAFVYVSGQADDSVAAFARDADTGALTYASRVVDGADGVDGLDGARAVAISGDGAHLYAAGEQDGAVAVFARDGVTGALTFVERAQQEASPLLGLNALAVSPDGAHVYATRTRFSCTPNCFLADSDLVRFARDGATGALTWLSTTPIDSVGAPPRLGGVASVAVSADGAFVLVGGDYLDLFARDAQTGAVTSLKRMKRRGNGVAIGPDGTQSYAATGDGLAVLAPEPAVPILGAVAAAALAALARARAALR